MKDKIKMLVVDNDPDGAKRIRKMIIEKEVSNITLTSCNNGTEALDLVKKGGFDIILVNDDMPKMTGIEFIEKLREDGKTTPVILIVEGTFNINLIGNPYLRILGYLEKPFAFEKLIECIETAMSYILKEPNK